MTTGSAARRIRVGRRRERALAAARPWLAARRTWLILIGLAALTVRLPLFFIPAEVNLADDSQGYLEYARGIGEADFPGMIRTPGYPFFLWFTDLFPGPMEDTAIVAQHLIGVVLAVGVLALGWRLFSPAAGVLAGALVAISPAYVTLEESHVPDYLFGVVAFAGAAALALAVSDGRIDRRLLVLAGVMFALSAYIKPVGQVLILAAPIVLLASTRSLRVWVVSSAVVIGAMLLTMGPWLVRNAVLYNDAGMSNQAGLTLYNRAFEIDRFPVPSDDPVSARATELTRIADADSVLRPSSHVYNELVHDGRSGEEALDIQQRLALKAIWRHPVPYLRTTGSRVRGSVEEINTQTWPHRVEKSPAGLRHVADAGLNVGRRLAGLWYVLSAHVLAALVMLLVPATRRPALAFLTVGVLILVFTVLTHGGMYRYSMQAAPEAWLVGSAGLVYVIGAVIARLRGPRAGDARADNQPTAQSV